MLNQFLTGSMLAKRDPIQNQEIQDGPLRMADFDISSKL
jgi:hypothetical protein